MSSLEALIIVTRPGCRVTFLASCVLVEVRGEDPGAGFVWSEIGRGASYAEAVQAAARKEGWLA